MSTLKVDAIVDKSSGNTATINGQTPSSSNMMGRNLIINGAMQVAQRGTSSTSSDYASLDRWRNSHGGGTVTQTQESLTSGDPYDDGHRNFLRATNTAAGSTAATDSLQIYQTIESQNLANSGWDSTSASSNITLSAWVRSSLAGTYYVRLYIYDGNKNYTFPITLSANTWTKITKSIPGASGNTVNDDNGAGMFVNFAAYLGTDNTDSGFTINQWATFSSTSQAPDYAQNWRSTGSATFDVTGVQLEVGGAATDFEHRSFGDQLAACQRYYQRTQGSASGYQNLVVLVNYSTGTDQRGVIPFTTEMREGPAVSTSGNLMILGAGGNLSSISAGDGLTTHMAGIRVNTTSNLSTGQATLLRGNNDGTAHLQFEAEL